MCKRAESMSLQTEAEQLVGRDDDEASYFGDGVVRTGWVWWSIIAKRLATRLNPL